MTAAGDRAVHPNPGMPCRLPPLVSFKACRTKASAIMQDYDFLCVQILDALTGKLLPPTSWHIPERNEQHIAIAVCQTMGMTPERWDRLSKDERLPWLHKTLKALESQPAANVWFGGDDLPTHRPEFDRPAAPVEQPTVGGLTEVSGSGSKADRGASSTPDEAATNPSESSSTHAETKRPVQNPKPPPSAQTEFAKPTDTMGSTLITQARDINDANGSFQDYGEFVRICGLGEDVTLEKTEGVERLIAIVTAPTRRYGVMELAKIGAAQQVSDRDSVDLDADRLTERESVDDEQYESALGDDASQVVRDEVGDLIARKKAAVERGDVAEAKTLKQQIDAVLNPLKPALGNAAKTVKNSLDRTYKRLRKDGIGKLLAAHFDKYVTRPRQSAEFVYAPDESKGKIVWIVK